MNVKRMAAIGMIAALYAGLTLVLAPISYGPIQVRISEMLTMLPLFYSPAVWGVTLGCFISNLVGVFLGINLLGVYDIFIGTAATLIAALITVRFKDIKIHNIPWISIAAPIIMNGLFVGLELAYVLMPDTLLQGFVINAFQVALGEAIAVIVLYPLVKIMAKRIPFEQY